MNIDDLYQRLIEPDWIVPTVLFAPLFSIISICTYYHYYGRTVHGNILHILEISKDAPEINYYINYCNNDGIITTAEYEDILDRYEDYKLGSVTNGSSR